MAGEGGGATAGPVADRLKLAGVVGLIAPLIGTLSLFKATGTIGRLQRDEPVPLMIAVLLVVIAGALFTIGSYRKGKKTDGANGGDYNSSARLFGSAIALTAVGFLLAVYLVVNNANAESRPQITASLNQAESKLTAIVTASNLATNDRLAIKVDLATLIPGKGLDDDDPFVEGGSRGLERAYVGPDADGEAEQKISLPIPAGGSYTDVIVRAFTGGGSIPCQERPEGTPDPGTACMFLALEQERGGS
jgi:hypothetical protein